MQRFRRWFDIVGGSMPHIITFFSTGIHVLIQSTVNYLCRRTAKNRKVDNMTLSNKPMLGYRASVVVQKLYSMTKSALSNMRTNSTTIYNKYFDLFRILFIYWIYFAARDSQLAFLCVAKDRTENQSTNHVLYSSWSEIKRKIMNVFNRFVFR